jgi:TonB family protein
MYTCSAGATCAGRRDRIDKATVGMFQGLPSSSKKRSYSILASLLFEALLILVFVYHAPIFVTPSSVAWGQHGTSEALVYLAQPQAQAHPTPKKVLLKPKKKRQEKVEQAKNEVEVPRAGTPYGSLYQGPGSGQDARPALPLVFPDPSVYSWQLGGLQGDVIVEVTIDEHGNVTETRVLQSLKDEIDQKVLATVRNWRFRPATVDGMAISSRQDVHFHFPS